MKTKYIKINKYIMETSKEVIRPLKNVDVDIKIKEIKKPYKTKGQKIDFYA